MSSLSYFRLAGMAAIMAVIAISFICVSVKVPTFQNVGYHAYNQIRPCYV